MHADLAGMQCKSVVACQKKKSDGTLSDWEVLRVRRPAAQVLGRNLEALITAAENIKGKWGDDFVSVEHLVLALEDDSRFGQPLLRQEGLSTAKLEEAIKAIRGGNRVTDQARARAARTGRSQRCGWAPLSLRVYRRSER